MLPQIVRDGFFYKREEIMRKSHKDIQKYIVLIHMLNLRMNSRCAGCKYLRRRCPSDCVLSPYFPGNDPQRFEYVHKIYGASNVTKMLQKVGVDQRGEAANSLCYEAYCRVEDPVYGCVGIITQLTQEIYNAQCQLAKIQADIAVLSGRLNIDPQVPSFAADADYSALQPNAMPIYLSDTPAPSTAPPF